MTDEKKPQISNGLGAQPAGPDAAPMPAGGEGSRTLPVTRITVENPTCFWCPSWAAEGEWCLHHDRAMSSDEPVCRAFYAFGPREDVEPRTSAVQPEPKPADATQPPEERLLKAEAELSTVRRERDALRASLARIGKLRVEYGADLITAQWIASVALASETGGGALSPSDERDGVT